jgi:hypothetical protein
VGPTDRGWRRGSLYRGDGEGVLVHGEKREAIWLFFAIGEGIVKLLELL